MMAVSDLCLACGRAAVSGERRITGEEGKDSNLTMLWNNLAAKELEKTGENVDLEVFLRHRPGPFFCRKCFRAYGNLMTAMKVSLLAEYESVRYTSTTFKALESNMEMAVSAMITVPSLIHHPRIF